MKFKDQNGAIKEAYGRTSLYPILCNIVSPEEHYKNIGEIPVVDLALIYVASGDMHGVKPINMHSSKAQKARAIEAMKANIIENNPGIQYKREL